MNRVAQATYPDTTAVNYVYDTLNRLQTLTAPSAFGSGNFGFTYDALSRRTQLTRPNSVTTTYGYDDLSRLLNVTHKHSATTIDGTVYTVDAVGNRKTLQALPSNTTSTFTYDAIYQLTKSVQGATTKETYTYDVVGNRLSSLGVTPYAYNSSNELTSKPGVTYTYDNNGNTLTKTDASGVTHYTWDFENRLTSVQLPGSGGTVNFKYDPLGRRIYKSSTAATSVCAYDGINLVEETNASGSVVARYSQGASFDEPLAMLRSSATSYYETDGLGSVTSLSNGARAAAETYTYDSFGKQIATSGSLTNPFHHTARELDGETNLTYMRARYYDPVTGRFLSEDPVGFSVGINFYEYVLNNPINLVDPVGLMPWPYDLYEKARKKLGKADCLLSAFACNVRDQVNALNAMLTDAITNTTEAQQQNGQSATGNVDFQRLQLCLAADQNCKDALERCIKLALTNPFSPPSWITDLINYLSKHPSAPAPLARRE